MVEVPVFTSPPSIYSVEGVTATVKAATHAFTTFTVVDWLASPDEVLGTAPIKTVPDLVPLTVSTAETGLLNMSRDRLVGRMLADTPVVGVTWRLVLNPPYRPFLVPWSIEKAFGSNTVSAKIWRFVNEFVAIVTVEVAEPPHVATFT